MIGSVVSVIIVLGSFIAVIQKFTQPINELRMVIQELKIYIENMKEDNIIVTNKLNKHEERIDLLEHRMDVIYTKHEMNKNE